MFAFHQMTLSRSRFQADFLLLDEIFDRLDADGQSKVVQVLLNTLGYNKFVWVITHSDSIDERVNRLFTVRVTKDDTGSRYHDPSGLIKAE
jgi:DNA repair exonuclease SbcCD ATPase subunit